MKISKVLPAALAVPVLLAGCIQMDTVVRVNADGSGTVRKTFVMSRDFLERIETSMKRMAEGLGVRPPREEVRQGFEVLRKDELRREAAAMGDGVSLASAEPLETDWGKGYRAVFRFKGVNRLKLNLNPMDSLPGGAPEDDAGEEGDQWVLFHLVAGDPVRLFVDLPHKPLSGEHAPHAPDEATEPSMGGSDAYPQGDVPDEPEDAEDLETAMQVEQTRALLRGMKVRLAVEVEGKIVRTDAAHRDGEAVVLMDMDFASLDQAPGKLEAFTRWEPESFQDLENFMKGVPGARWEPASRVEIDFRPPSAEHP